MVIGAGLIGMLSAYELANAGMQVTVLERGQPARESSWAGGGILSPLYPWRYPDPVNELASWSQRVYPDLCRQLEESSGIDPQWTRSGLMIADIDDRQSVQQWATRFEARLEWCDGCDVHRIEPRLGLVPESAAWLPEVAQVRNPRLVQALRTTLVNTGVEIRPDCPAQGWIIEADRVKAVQTPGGEVGADCFVVASGAWSAELLQSTGLSLPVEPVRGQMILYKGPPGLVSCITLYAGRYVIPRRDGRVLVGSTLEYVGFDKHTTQQGLDDLRQAAGELIPDLAALPIEKHWAGLRPGSPDGTPLVGPHPDIVNLYINAGHFRNGVVLGPATARMLADHVLRRPAALEQKPYLPVNRIDVGAT
ncbi:MAG: glycine oxidase ThiO [Gammaproteobacteria bacterium]|nr:MAG: glycine oxidase ThiO [Gammaproteobacteria bacterium]